MFLRPSLRAVPMSFFTSGTRGGQWINLGLLFFDDFWDSGVQHRSVPFVEYLSWVLYIYIHTLIRIFFPGWVSSFHVFFMIWRSDSDCFFPKKTCFVEFHWCQGWWGPDGLVVRQRRWWRGGAVTPGGDDCWTSWDLRWLEKDRKRGMFFFFEEVISIDFRLACVSYHHFTPGYLGSFFFKYYFFP